MLSDFLTELLIILALTLANGLFSGSEIAIVSARRNRLETEALAGSRGAQQALELSKHPDRFLATVQVGITLIGTFSAAFGGARIGDILTVWLAQIPVLAEYAETVSLGLVVIILTYLSLVIGELVPKQIALQHAERFAAAAAPIIHHLLEEFRGRAHTHFTLPPTDSCEIAFVNDVPWRAYNWYQGNGKSRIELNQDLPLEFWDIPTTIAHETYPGHHTERLIKEHQLYLGEGRLEHAIALSNTPSALISEGIAANALLTLLSEDDLAAIFIDCYERAGLSRQDAVLAPAFVAAYRQLESVVDNQVLLLYRDQAPEQEVIAYGMRYALTNAADEAHLLQFIKDPLSRSYTYNYTLGRELIATYLDRAAARQQAFQRLLTAPLTPSQIRHFSTMPGE